MLKKYLPLVLLIICFPTTSFATLLWSWQLGTDKLYLVEDEIFIHATLINEVESTENFTKDFLESAAYDPLGNFPYWGFDFGSGPESFSFFPQFDGMNLAPGQSFDFIFGRLTPKNPDTIPQGVYDFSTTLRVAGGSQENMFTLEVNNGEVLFSSGRAPDSVPAPVGIWLYIIGLVGVVPFTMYKRIKMDKSEGG